MYLIDLSDNQRLLIIRAINHLITKEEIILENEPSNQPWPENNLKEVEVLKTMFEDLPKEEAETPGAIHGFSL